jgi:enoyl-[acyl-carrier-protein] reductase (NADH)
VGKGGLDPDDVASMFGYGSGDAMVQKLAQFYADRTLTKSPITPADQAEAYLLLVTGRLSKTTGQIIPVDGGLHEAFLR